MTVSDTKAINVYNMTNQTVVYIIEEDNVRRRFSAYETKKITAKELRKLYYIEGGDVLLQDYLCVQEPELAKEFGVPDDMIEYYWKQEDVDKLLSEGSIEELEDAIEFGPRGLRELIKDRAVETQLNDLSKRKVIDDMLGIDLEFMTEMYLESQDGDEEKKPSKRRVQRNADNAESTSGRRVKH